MLMYSLMYSFNYLIKSSDEAAHTKWQALQLRCDALSSIYTALRSVQTALRSIQDLMLINT